MSADNDAGHVAATQTEPIKGGMDPERDASATVLAFTADLDVPGETKRQARVFAAWLLCLAIAVVAGSIVGAHVALEDDGSSRAAAELSRSRWAKARMAFAFGIVLPALLTFAINRHHKRGGAHARGIVVDVTSGGELRLWGRGYGTRVVISGSDVRERLVDVYAGRLGAWRQRRIVVRGKSVEGGKEIELATTALATDEREGLRVEGGEGDCVELEREDFDSLRDAIIAKR